MSDEWWFSIRCAELHAVEEEQIGGDMTQVYTEDGDKFFYLPGHGLAKDLVKQVAAAVVRAEDRGQEIGEAEAFRKLRGLIRAAGLEDS